MLGGWQEVAGATVSKSKKEKSQIVKFYVKPNLFNVFVLSPPPLPLLSLPPLSPSPHLSPSLSLVLR